MKVKSILVGNPLGTRILLPLVLLASLAIVPNRVFAQESSEPAKTESSDAAKAQAAAAIRIRIERARALAAAHRLQHAAGELESLRSTAAADDVVRNVTSVMLMSIYLEEGNYARAESLLEETFRARATQKERSIRTYFALAGQAVNGARAHIARYRNFGINVSDAGLPAEALSDLNRLRSLLERMIAQAREISKDDSKAYDSLALLEDVLGIRLSLAREGEDSEKWSTEYAGARHGLSLSQKQVASIGGMPPPSTEMRSPVAGKTTSPAPEPKDETTAPKEPQHDTTGAQPGTKTITEGAIATDSNTLSVGSLNHWATKKVVPKYPQPAKASGIVGVVRVYVGTNTDGRVVGVYRSEGPPVLRQAAESAARQWRFQPAIVADKRFGLTGFIEFNFTP
ncbi:MAG: TonB family protein [Pyrinomonadaceae bacterium]|nr:TonB family protein [Pyrinomonadaceae bacterium]